MSLTTSRLPKTEAHPPLCRALKTVMTVTGTTGVDLAAAVDRSQSAVARYYNDREPDFAMTVLIEEALGLPGGTLFALAGYTPSTSDVDALAALDLDPSLTLAQKERVAFGLIEALRARGAHSGTSDVVKALEQDARLSTTRRDILTEIVRCYREENVERGRVAGRTNAPPGK
jgi:hypothetical protein